jgi:glycolate oxidase FAD binding subunit
MSPGAAAALEGAFPDGTFEAPVEADAWAVGGARPLGIASPGSVDELRQVLAGAARAGVGVVPLGGGTDRGCEAPSGPFVVLSTRRLAGIEDYEPADLTVTAAAGTSLADLERALTERGQWLPVDPPHRHRRTLGGLVATGAAGPLGTTYGAPRDHVLGLTVVTGDGRVLRLGGRVMKNVAGFDLVKLVVGSRGTLGVVASATVRLFPRPEEDRALVIRGVRPGELIPLARAVATSPVVPASAVLVAPAPGRGGGALIVRLQGASAAVDADAARILAGSAVDAERVAGPDASALFDTAADHAAHGEVVVRATALPAALAEVMSAVAEALPDAAVAADVLAGRIRAAIGDAARTSAEALATLRTRLEALGGSLSLERAPSELVAEVGAYGAAGRSGALAASLRRRFDPGRVLSPGRFVA